MLKKMMSVVAVAGVVLALAGTAQAALIGYWNFDNDTLVESSSYMQTNHSKAAGYNDAVLATGSVAYANGNTGFGRALDLTGGDNAVRVQNEAGRGAGALFDDGLYGSGTGNGSQPFTVTLWVKGWSSNLSAAFIARTRRDYPSGDNNGWHIATGASDASLADIRWGNQGVAGDNGVDLTDGQWHHLAMVEDTNNVSGTTRFLYVDGDLAGSDTGVTMYGTEYSYLVSARKCANIVDYGIYVAIYA